MQRPAILLLLGIIAVGLLRFIFWPAQEQTVAATTKPQAVSVPMVNNGGYASTLQVAISSEATQDKTEQLEALRQEMLVALGRYRSVQLVDAGAEYRLVLDEHVLGNKAGQQFTMQLKHAPDSSVVFCLLYTSPSPRDS